MLQYAKMFCAASPRNSFIVDTKVGGFPLLPHGPNHSKPSPVTFGGPDMSAARLGNYCPLYIRLDFKSEGFGRLEGLISGVCYCDPRLSSILSPFLLPVFSCNQICMFMFWIGSIPLPLCRAGLKNGNLCLLLQRPRQHRASRAARASESSNWTSGGGS